MEALERLRGIPPRLLGMIAKLADAMVSGRMAYLAAVEDQAEAEERHERELLRKLRVIRGDLTSLMEAVGVPAESDSEPPSTCAVIPASQTHKPHSVEMELLHRHVQAAGEITNARVQKLLGIDQPAAANLLIQLVNSGLIAKVSPKLYKLGCQASAPATNQQES